MRLIDHAFHLLGKQRPLNANVAADRARQRDLHGQGLRQTADETSKTRLAMEEELDRQRQERLEPPAG